MSGNSFFADKVPDRTGQFVYDEWLKFLEIMRDVWPVRLAMLKADQAGDLGEVDKLRPDLQAVAQRARKPLAEALKWRLAASLAYEKNEEFRKQEDEACSKDPVRFINHWCFTSDPRLAPLGINPMIPFVLWPKQEEFILWIHDAYTTGRSWLAEKSRGWGLTWLLSAYYAWHWRYHSGFIGGFGSRDKDAVDKLGDPDTILAKARFVIYNLPQSMQPEAYRGKSVLNQSSFDNYMRIVNPDNESVIRGEGGDNIGAGGRASMYVIDESALVQYPQKIDDALSYTTNCRGDVSTVRGMNHFGEKRHSGRVRVFTCWYYQDPSKHADWRSGRRPLPEECPFLEYELLEKGELVVNQELLMDYSRSVEGAFIPADWVSAAVDFDIPAEGERQSGFDLASGGDNHSAYVKRVGSVAYSPREIDYETPQEALEEALNFAEEDQVGLFAYDQDGIGESVWGHVKVTGRKIRFNLYGIHGNSAASDKYLYADGMRADEKFVNKRAENWWNIRERFRKTYECRKGVRVYDYNEMISIPNNTKLITQLSQPKKILGNNGKTGVESKVRMRGRQVKSPDLADALVNAFADAAAEATVMSNFSYRDDEKNVLDFEIDHNSPIGEQYVSLVTLEDRMTYALLCWWSGDRSYPQLKVYYETVEPVIEVEKIVLCINSMALPDIKPIRVWLCDEGMIKGSDKTNKSLWHEYRKWKVNLRVNYADDYDISINVANVLFKNKIAQIHATNCERLCSQMTNWRMENGKPAPGLGFAMAFCQMVMWLKIKKRLTAEHVAPSWQPRRLYNRMLDRNGAVVAFDQRMKENKKLPKYYKTAERQTEDSRERVEV